jgi:hypothetical protein
MSLFEFVLENGLLWLFRLDLVRCDFGDRALRPTLTTHRTASMAWASQVLLDHHLSTACLAICPEARHEETTLSATL